VKITQTVEILDLTIGTIRDRDILSFQVPSTYSLYENVKGVGEVTD
jgi:hypothetical protein